MIKIDKNGAIYMTEIIDYYEKLGNRELINDILFMIITDDEATLKDEIINRFTNATVNTINACLRLLYMKHVLIRYSKDGNIFYKINKEYFKDKSEYNNIKKYFE